MVTLLFAATIEPACDLSLTHDASYLVAFGNNGKMVLTDDRHIHLYRHDGSKYSLVGKISHPDGVTKHCYKAVSDTTIFVQENTDQPTHQYDSADLHQQGTLHHKGKLLGVLYPSTLVYGQKRAYEDWIIALHQPEGKVILKPPGARKWDVALSVCRTEDYFVVVETFTKSMAVFSCEVTSYCCAIIGHDI